jgi:hypothetical protein
VLYNRAVRRVCAIGLLVLFSSSLIPLALFADSPGSKLPACCRRDGKHACSMMDAQDEPSGIRISGKLRCTSYPKGDAAPGAGTIFTPQPRAAGISVVVVRLRLAEQTEARYRVAFSRGWQKRGPPSLLS